ncbi:MAG: Mut7-C ubiquitin/RNAse domain-containing protein [Spirochaetaceae bacterium]|nr:Mut7-C ubiquitin/RNAse domain-containing protein [Spirochaetaceae bacterium]
MVTIRFYEELNDFLEKNKRKVSYSVKTNPGQTVKDLIESENVPHTEVDLILVNSNSVDFSYQVMNMDRISVYPVFESLDIKNATKLRPLPLRTTLFILDVNLGKLARYLRIGGFDTLYSNSYKDKEIAEISVRENRILLTRDRDLLKRSIIQRGHWIRSQNAVLQYQDVLERFDLNDSVSLYSRCPQCNGNLRQVDKKDILDKLAPKTAMYYDNFKTCDSCGKIYWKGSHYYNFIKMTRLEMY